MDNKMQALVDAYRRPDGVIDWYKVFDLPRLRRIVEPGVRAY